jgi:large subunit ribosomal protein L10
VNKEQKAAVVDEIAASLKNTESIFAIDYRGISVSQAAQLRARLREADATFTVVKNRLAKRAAEKAGTDGLDELFEGPTALALVKGDPVIVAKAIATFTREHQVLAYKGGLMDGAPLDPDSFMSIARLPGLDVLHGQLVGLTASPLTGVVRGLNALLAGLASQLGQIQEKGLVEGEAETAPEAEATEEEAPEKEATDAEEPPAEEAEPAAEAEEEEPAAEAEEEEPAAEAEEETSEEKADDEKPEEE